jgi:quercetin dioxygenase-like cupin family protein
MYVPTPEYKAINKPDETREFPKGKVELINIGGGQVGRITLEPGWKWSEHVKPVAGTEWCEAPHFQYQLQGRMHVKNMDGSEFELGPGDVSALPAGHDAWVIGDEAVVVIDWSGASNYAK